MSPFHPTVTGGLVAVAAAVRARGTLMIPRARDAPDAIDGLRVRAAPVGEPDQVEGYGPTGDALNLLENWKTGEDSFFVDDLVYNLYLSGIHVGILHSSVGRRDARRRSFQGSPRRKGQDVPCHASPHMRICRESNDRGADGTRRQSDV